MKYAVITYIFGKNKEILREPLFIDEDVEYICVTDQKDLKSKNWKIIYDEIPEAKCVRDKMVYVKYNPFKYTNAEKICIIDGTLEIKNSLIPLFNQCKECDLLVKNHSERNNLFDELNEWIKTRNMPKTAINMFETMAKRGSYNLKTKILYESCVLVYSNIKEVKDLCLTVIDYMKFLGKETLFLSNQCVLTFLLNTEFKNLKKDYINQKVLFTRYNHGTKTLHDR